MRDFFVIPVAPSPPRVLKIRVTDLQTKFWTSRAFHRILKVQQKIGKFTDTHHFSLLRSSAIKDLNSCLYVALNEDGNLCLRLYFPWRYLKFWSWDDDESSSNAGEERCEPSFPKKKFTTILISIVRKWNTRDYKCIACTRNHFKWEQSWHAYTKDVWRIWLGRTSIKDKKQRRPPVIQSQRPPSPTCNKPLEF